MFNGNRENDPRGTDEQEKPLCIIAFVSNRLVHR